VRSTYSSYLGLHDLRSMNSSIMDREGVDTKNAQFRRGHGIGQSGDRTGNLLTWTGPGANG
jgi:hypothetical protein